jgi:hypothetical protein
MRCDTVILSKTFSSTLFTCKTKRLRHVLEARHPLPCQVGCTDLIKEHSMANHTDIPDLIVLRISWCSNRKRCGGQFPIFERTPFRLRMKMSATPSSLQFYMGLRGASCNPYALQQRLKPPSLANLRIGSRCCGI